MNIKEIMEKYSLKDGAKVEKALRNIESGRVYLYSMSGKMGSGKDTVGNAIARELSYSRDVKQTSFATALRKEIDEIVTQIREGKLMGLIAKEQGVYLNELRTLLYYLGKDSIYDRTPGSRKAVQYWGTDVRRKQNANYWVNKTVEYVIEEASKGNTVYVTDSRFPNEAKSIEDLGGTVIRLDVPREVRIDRITYRDGNPPTGSQMAHESEVALDNHKFKVRVDGCKKPAEIAEEVLKKIKGS